MPDTNLLTGQPKDLYQRKQELLSFIDSSLENLDRFNYDEIPHIDHQLVRLPSLQNYFNDDNFIPTIRAFHDVVRGLLQEFRSFVEQCSDLDTIKRFEDGLSSHTMDFRMFRTAADELAEKQDSPRTTLQYNQSLNNDVARITSENVNIPELILQLQGNPEAIQGIKNLIMASVGGFPVEEEGMISAYLEFVKVLESLDTKIDTSEAVVIIIEFLVAVKHVSDFATNTYLKDTLSNIFNILANYFTAVGMGQMFYQDKLNDEAEEA